MPRVPINNFDMRYEVTGAGAPFIFAHGLMGSIDASLQMGEDIPGAVGDIVTVITYDARGHGQSTHTDAPEDYHWESLARDMRALFEHLECERAYIGGGSMGAGTSIMFALDNPDLVEALILVAPPPFGDSIIGARQMFTLFADVIERHGMEKAVDFFAQTPDAQQLKKASPEQFETLMRNMRAQNPKGLVAAIRGLLGGPQVPVDRFGEIKAPVFIIGHPGDPIHPLSSIEMLEKAIPHATKWIAPEAMYLQSRPGKLGEIIRDYLAPRES